MYILKPRDRAPELEIATLDDGDWRLHAQAPPLFTMVVFYRGLFCPSCRDYLSELHRRLDAFDRLGVETIAVSMDDESRARETQRRLRLDGLTMGYALTRDQADAWGLYLTDRGERRPGTTEVFNEPGLFLVRRNGNLYAAFVQSAEFARPNLEQVLSAIGFMTDE